MSFVPAVASSWFMTAPGDVDVLGGMAVAWETVTSAADFERVSRWTGELSGLAASQQRIVSTGGWAAGPSTLMGVLDLQRGEVANCRVVRWLFDPLARHGIGARMISSLATKFDVAIDDPSAFRAEAEVGRPNSRADLVLTSTKTIVIEAKIDAAEGPQQGARLEVDWPAPAVLGFLTVAGQGLPTTATDDSRWRPVSWLWIADAALEALENTTESTDDRSIEARATVRVWTQDVERYLR